MKGLVKVILVLAGLAGALWWLAVLALHLTAGAQTRAALGLLNDAEGITAEAQEIRLYLDGAGLRKLRLIGDEGDRVDIEHARLRVSVWPLLWRGEIDVREISVGGLVVEPSHRSFAAVPDTAAAKTPPDATLPADAPPASDTDPRRQRRSDRAGLPFEGLLQTTQRDAIPVRVRQADLDGTLLLPDDQRMAMRIALRGFAPGREGRLEAVFDAVVSDPEIPLHATELRLDLDIQQAAAGGIEALEGRIYGVLETPDAPDPIRLDTSFSAQPSALGERYRIQARREGLDDPLLNLDTEWFDADRRIEGQLRVAFTEAAIAGIPRWPGMPPVPARGLLEFNISAPATPGAEPEGTFRLAGEADLPALLERTDAGLQGSLDAGTAVVDLEAHVADTEGTLTGTVELTGVVPEGHPGPPFSAHHDTRIRWQDDAATVRGPLRLTGPRSESRGTLTLQTAADAPYPGLQLELDRFDEEEWAPVLEILPDPKPRIRLTGAAPETPADPR
ncbi:hypothetical protein TVNIR_1303 [Thioalkalivibrio nitratireducens DSM 14787]|uniref:Uncharacterized protein n=1 Tax=Thioalkalivibrio nitratireducens (strain DSM 14787 / UNIQEM 213 / ALEN2) TaxID=1255043 RepID=L0DXA1_THIND|nr:hypothetical protein [Thioalkalivibrio nitratireducens]AGA32976.1 hypothetical protein TVNIR_1303 [Thioalkalivibrio nitratireducens DSM 14787]